MSARVEFSEDSDQEVIVVHDDESEEDECLDMSNPLAHMKKSLTTSSAVETLGRPPSHASTSVSSQGRVVQLAFKQTAKAKAKTKAPSSQRVFPSSKSESSGKGASVPSSRSSTPSPPQSKKKGGQGTVQSPIDLPESEEDEAFVEKASVKVHDVSQSPPSSDIDEVLVPATKPSVTLSKWASRFLTPRAPAALVEEVDLQPMQDFILDDFRTRFRGDTVSDEIADDGDGDSDGDDASNRLVVGRPIVQKGPPPTGATKAADTAAPPKPRKESRYFRKDLTTKCFNCGEIGHMSNACVNSTVLRPCFMCGYRDHKANECPHLLCHRCNEPGHEARNCPSSRRHYLDYCETCGAADHGSQDCPPRLSDPKLVRCMVCLQRGHLNCVPHNRPANKRIYCPKCCGSHTAEECYGGRGDSYRGRSSYDDNRHRYNDSDRSSRSDKTCYKCNETGHIAAQCPDAMSKPRHGVKHQRFESSSDNYSSGHKRQRVDHDNQSYARKHFSRR